MQRVTNKLDNWYSKLLSHAGKEVLIKSYLLYVMLFTSKEDI